MAVDGIVVALRGAGGTALYRRNAFRLTGLPTDADRRTVRHRQRRVLAALEAGADVDLGHDLPVGTEAVRVAFDEILENPHRRLVDELFWLWGNGSACGCPGTVHADHDDAVRAHSMALDLETTGRDRAAAGRAWKQAATLWGTVLRRNDFWNHVRARIAALDERQLDESTVTVLREQVPLTLLQPLIDLVVDGTSSRATTISRARAWPGVPSGTVDHLLEDAAASRYEAAESAIAEAGEALLDDEPERAASLFHENVVPALHRLGTLVPHERHRRTARLRDRAALVLNNCATTLIDRDGPSAEDDAGDWLATALEFAADPESERTIRANQATLAQMVDAFQVIESQVDQLLAAGRPDVARRMLLGIRRQLNGGTGTAEIDRLLDRVGGRPAYRDTYSDRALARGWWALHRRKVLAFLAFVVVVILVYRNWPRGDDGTLFAPNIGDNHPLGTCVATKAGWEGNDGKAEVPVVACDEPHWAEVLGYAPLGKVPSPSPAQEQITALAEFECGWLLAEQDLPDGEYTTTNAHPDVASWNTGENGSEFDNYATCLLHRADDRPIDRFVLADPLTRSDDVAVAMNLYGGPIWDNAPVGTCVRDQPAEDASLLYLPVVRCDQPHWAEILGYPRLYDKSTAWPGDDAVWQTASAACEKQPLPAGFAVEVRWPAREFWDEPDLPIYAACLAHRDDHQQFTGGVR